MTGLPGHGWAKDDKNRARLLKAVTIRHVERRLLDLHAQGQVAGTVHTCLGQEWTGVAVAEALRLGDFVFSNHRCHGHFLAWTDDVEGLIAEIMGHPSGVCGGRGGSQHLATRGFLANGIIGGMAPVAAGWAMAAKRRAEEGGEPPTVAVLFLGDGAMAQGVVFEALNAAAAFRLPLLVVCEVNGIAQSTIVSDVQAGTPATRAAAFGIQTLQADGRDLPALFETTRDAVAQVRAKGTPVLLSITTARLGPHSKGDDTRPVEELARLRREDPLTQILDDGNPDIRALIEAVAARIDQAVTAASAPPQLPVPTRLPSPALSSAGTVKASAGPARHIDAIRTGLGEALERDPRVLLLGEDIAGDYGGAFKATAGLSARFPGRILNGAISEAGLVGMGIGLALAGFRPIVEIMFGDFLGLTFDQLLNHAGKFADLGGEATRVPLIVRTPMGGRRGYGPTHSQSLEKHFLGVPGLSVVALHHRMDARGFYAGLPGIVTGPHLVIENKIAYGHPGLDRRVPGFDYLESVGGPFPTLTLRPGLPPHLTILCHGGMLIEVETAIAMLFEEEEIVCEVICPTLLHPFDAAPLRRSVARTGRLLTVEEGQGAAGIGAEAIAKVLEGLTRHDKSPVVRRVFAEPVAIAAAVGIEACQLPGAGTIAAAARRLIHGEAQP